MGYMVSLTTATPGIDIILGFGVALETAAPELEVALNDYTAPINADLVTAAPQLSVNVSSSRIYNIDLSVSAAQIDAEIKQAIVASLIAGAVALIARVVAVKPIDVALTVASPAVDVRLDQILSDSKLLLVVNASNGAVTTITDVDFNGFAVVGDDLYATGDSGISLIGGTTNNGSDISGSATFHKSDFASTKLKRIRKIVAVGRDMGSDQTITVASGTRSSTHAAPFLSKQEDQGAEVHCSREVFGDTFSITVGPAKQLSLERLDLIFKKLR